MLKNFDKMACYRPHKTTADDIFVYLTTVCNVYRFSCAEEQRERERMVESHTQKENNLLHCIFTLFESFSAWFHAQIFSQPKKRITHWYEIDAFLLLLPLPGARNVLAWWISLSMLVSASTYMKWRKCYMYHVLNRFCCGYKYFVCSLLRSFCFPVSGLSFNRNFLEYDLSISEKWKALYEY